MNSRAGFIVDGFTEKYILQSLCPGSKISRLDLNGKNVSVKAMATKIASIIRLNQGRNFPFVVLVDKENRNCTSREFRGQIVEELNHLNLESEDIRVGVADRMIENWVMADWNCLEMNVPRPTNVEGSNGSAELKKAIGSFNKTTDVVSYFLKASCETMCANSSSFEDFVNEISDLDCHFLDT